MTEFARSFGTPSSSTGNDSHQQIMETMWVALDQPEPEQELPLYIENGQDISSTVIQLKQAASSMAHPLPVEEFPTFPLNSQKEVPRIIRLRQKIVNTFFHAILAKNADLVTLLIQHHLVTANTTFSNGSTPLLTTISTHPANITLPKLLISLGADISAFGITEVIPTTTLRYPPTVIYRTPLQLAASKGSLLIVKLLLGDYGADDSIIAPDGETALRLAAKSHHSEIVEYLPIRRGGGFRRWKAKHRIAMRRAERAAKRIYQFGRFFVWEVPRFLLVTVPVRGILLPLGEKLVALWEHKGEIPGMIVAFCKKIWTGLKCIPEVLWRIIVGLAKIIWYVIGKTPKALAIMGLWAWDGVKTVIKAVLRVTGRVLSFLHTVFEAVRTFFRGLTVWDVWNGFVAAIRSILVDFPLEVGRWITAFGRSSYKACKALMGVMGKFVWWCCVALVQVFVIYLPKQMWRIVESFGQSARKAGEEVLIWWNPKRQL